MLGKNVGNENSVDGMDSNEESDIYRQLENETEDRGKRLIYTSLRESDAIEHIVLIFRLVLEKYDHEFICVSKKLNNFCRLCFSSVTVEK